MLDKLVYALIKIMLHVKKDMRGHLSENAIVIEI